MPDSRRRTLATVCTFALFLALPLVAAQGGDSNWGALKSEFGPAADGTLKAGNPGGPNGRPNSWADCERFAGVVTPANFNPDSDPFDELYAGGDGFKDGVPLISESKPGDADYNGGRWHMNVLKDGVPADKYSDACSVEDLDLDDFESTDNYFECPLLPRRGRGNGNMSG